MTEEDEPDCGGADEIEADIALPALAGAERPREPPLPRCSHAPLDHGCPFQQAVPFSVENQTTA